MKLQEFNGHDLQIDKNPVMLNLKEVKGEQKPYNLLLTNLLSNFYGFHE